MLKLAQQFSDNNAQMCAVLKPGRINSYRMGNTPKHNK